MIIVDKSILAALSSIDPSILQDITGLATTPLSLAYDSIITNDQNTIQAKDKCRKLSNSNLSVLIIGETGTGKELFARLLHGNRPGELISVNCGGIPDTLIEGEFFGSVKGAFTGAIDKPGLFEQATGGTIFLDEIAELERSLQSKLLRVIETKKVRRLGDKKELPLTCRIVSATNHEVEVLKNNNKLFRTDLFYRLAGSIIKLEPLRLRGDDKHLIADIISKQVGFPLPEDNNWYGNIRELINYIEETKHLSS
jgi:arginine utilization regulatory protein